MPDLLPLFPLETVLLPGVPLALHIFEPRYREMIGECLETKKPFGVLRASDEKIAEMGCTAEIMEPVKRYDDGRMEISTIGRRRFEVIEIHRERSFLQGEVLFVDDEPVEAGEGLKAERARALDLFAQVIALVGIEQDEIEAEAPLLSFQLAGALPIDLDFKQALLGIRSEPERLAGLVELFENILPKLKLAARRREKAGGNGHVL